MNPQTGVSSEPARWIPLMEYAITKGISLSTLRRHIKAHKIRFKVENGRYLLPDEDPTLESAGATPAPVAPSLPPARANAPSSASVSSAPVTRAFPDTSLNLHSERNEALLRTVQTLREELQKAREEIAELKTLIAFYEERLPQPRLDV